MDEPQRQAPPPAGASSVHVARFVVALMLLVTTALVGVSLDNRQLALKRRITLETFRADQLERRAAALKLKVEELQTPDRLRAAINVHNPQADSRRSSRN